MSPYGTRSQKIVIKSSHFGTHDQLPEVSDKVFGPDGVAKRDINFSAVDFV